MKSLGYLMESEEEAMRLGIKSDIDAVKEQTAAVIERLGKFVRVANAGLRYKIPGMETIAGIVDLRTQQLDLVIETKSKDNVFVKLILSVQYFVKGDCVGDAHYKLTNHEEQIKSYVLKQIGMSGKGPTIFIPFSANGAHYMAGQMRDGMLAAASAVKSS
jgi:hypothetical protein